MHILPLGTGKGAGSWICFDEFYGVLRACLNAQTAGPALIRFWRIRNLPTVNPVFNLREEPEISVVGCFNFSNFEDIVRAYLRTRPLRFTTRKIYDWYKFTRRLFADFIIHIIVPAERDGNWLGKLFGDCR
jgi:hypothetical protein